MRKTVRNVLIAIGLGLLLILAVWLTRDQTVDFSGTVQEITVRDKMTVFTITDAFENTLSICADDKTMYRLHKGKRITVDAIEAGDMISGNYRLFHKDRAGQVEVVDRTYYSETTWLSETEGYRIWSGDQHWEVTVNGGESYRTILSKEEITAKALKEAKKERYAKNSTNRRSDLSEVNSVDLRIGKTFMKDSRHDWVPFHLEEQKCIYVLWLQDKNDVMNHLYLYYDAYTGALLEWESVSD